METPKPGETGRGALIVIEGADRCGKSTQMALLVGALRREGVPVQHLRFPDRGTHTGRMIDAYLSNACSNVNLDDAAIHFLFASNRWEKHAEMRDALLSRTTLVVDRYSYSGAAYTAAKGIPALYLAWCKVQEAGLLAPDAVVYLALDAEAAAEREGYGEERYETPDMQRRVKQQVEALRDDTWSSIDAGQEVAVIASRVREIALGAVRSCGEGPPLGKLWRPIL
jgi:dTMP kinase